MKFIGKDKEISQTIAIDAPGTYDFERVMHVWRGDGSCDFFGTKPPVLSIYVDDVTVKNFGFKDGIVGIQVWDEGRRFKNIRLENVEGTSCFEPLILPGSVESLNLIDVRVSREPRSI